MPLYRFVMSNVLKQHDLDRADGRLAALRSAAPLVASIRDNALVSGYARELAGLLGMDVEEVRREVMRAAKQSNRRSNGGPSVGAGPAPDLDPERLPGMQVQLPDPHDRLLATERETAKLLIQNPDLFPDAWDGLTTTDFTHPAYAAVFAAVEKAAVELGGANMAANTEWVHRIGGMRGRRDPIVGRLAGGRGAASTRGGDRAVRDRELSRAPVADGHAHDRSAEVQAATYDPVESQHKYNQMFSELVVLEARRKALHTRSIGAED